MKKKTMVFTLAGAITLGSLIGTGTTFASSDDTAQQTPQVNVESKTVVTKWLQRVADYLGINIDGKTRKEVRKEVRQTIGENKKEHLYFEAKRLGISTEGKSNEQIRTEVKAAKQERKQERIYQAADKFGISTEGKSLEELKEEIKQARAEKKQKKNDANSN
ncbi:hypothetical protein [Bacillus sp. 165]|uniref:hypothetical protein n=1 Tax=Bacillus sp. 165 TaxID=1529117 RepID=UPI001ADD4BCA|nr:hypothetical protein [Bacillus sp. 165]MBO9129023.1 hypothetical protein [Bacillus sp. 165]